LNKASLISGGDRKGIESTLKLIKQCQISDDDIWNGTESMIHIVKHFTHEIKSHISYPDNLINFLFPKDHYFKKVDSKTYKIDNMMKIKNLKETICNKFSVENFENYSLTTVSGIPLNERACLANYGVGSLLQNWQLKLIVKDNSIIKESKEKGTSLYSVLFIIQIQEPPMMHRVMVSPMTTIQEVMDSLIKKLKNSH